MIPIRGAYKLIMDKKKNMYFILGIIAFFVVILIWAMKGNEPIGARLNKSPEPSSGYTNSLEVPGSGGKLLSYTQAVKEYQGRIVQFDAMCQAHPNNFTVKNGTAVMFDNRSGDGRWFSLNNFGYYLKGYGFTVITLSSRKLPLTVVVDCGSAQNVAQILIQK